MKKKQIIILLMQIVLVAITMFLMLNYVNNRVKPVEVYVYTSDFEDSENAITSADVQLVSVPADAVSEGFALDIEDIVGKYVDGKVYRGQYVYEQQLVTKENRDVFDGMDLSRLRKISLPITYQEAFAGEIKRGDTIDLLYVGKGTSPAEGNGSYGQEFTYSKVFMSDVLVYSVSSENGFKYVPHGDATVSTEPQEIVELGIVTLAVTLDQAEQIQARLSTGDVKFIGRFPESENYNTLGYVLGEYGKVFSGKVYAETDALELVEDEFQEVIVR